MSLLGFMVMLIRICGSIFFRFKPEYTKTYENKPSENIIQACAIFTYDKNPQTFTASHLTKLKYFRKTHDSLRKYSHDLSGLAVRASRQDLHTPQVIRWDDPGLQLQTHAAAVVTRAKRLHSWGNTQRLAKCDQQQLHNSFLTCDLLVLCKQGFIK